jgi:hypothetical protein
MKKHYTLPMVLSCLRKAYPQGVPGSDLLPLLVVLCRHLSETDVGRIATEIVVRGVTPVTGKDPRSIIGTLTSQVVGAADVARVASQLQGAGLTDDPPADDDCEACSGDLASGGAD